jgi:serine/threonine protein kinase
MDVSTIQVPGFTLKSYLGHGGFGVVFRGEEVSTGREAAIKIAYRHRREDDIVLRWEREIEALRELGPPVVPAFFASGTLAEGRLFFAMELLRGTSLSDILAESAGSLDVAQIERIADAILHALGTVHEKGWVHRDLKPENIFIEPDGSVRLLDFGIARDLLTNEQLTQTGNILGSSEYISPEQLACKPVDARADCYALGVLLYELTTGRPPFVGAQYEIEYGHFIEKPATPDTLAEIPSHLSQVIMTCLEKEPNARPKNAAALRTLLFGQ